MPGLQVDGVKVVNYRHALALTSVPKRLVVVGAGAIGMEFAYVFRSYGAEVTVIEMLPHVLPLEDDETAAEVAKAFKKQGIKTLVNTRTEGVDLTADGVTVRVKDGASGAEQAIAADVVLVAIGVAPNSGGLGLEAAGVQTDKRGFIPVDEVMRTNVPGVYAIGDVTGKLLLAHVASAQGIVAAETIAGHETRPIKDADYIFMPRCTYCKPQVASLGYTEAQAKEKGYEIKIGKFPFVANGKALGLNEKEGFVKIIADAKYGEILGRAPGRSRGHRAAARAGAGPHLGADDRGDRPHGPRGSDALGGADGGRAMGDGTGAYMCNGKSQITRRISSNQRQWLA